MTLRTIPDIEAVLGGWLREHADVSALGARVAGSVPSKESEQVAPWVKVTQLDAGNVEGVEHLIDYLVQFDCYAGADATRDFVGQAEASSLARTVRAALRDAQGRVLDSTVVVSRVRFTGMARIPDTDYEPARERFVLTATVHGHHV